MVSAVVALLRTLALLAVVQVMTAAGLRADEGSRSSADGNPVVGEIDHRVWQHFLDTYARPSPDGINRVDYGRVSSSDRERLRTYLQMLAGTAVSKHGRNAQLAYWVNLYNALTVSVVLDHYPVTSIRDIGSLPPPFSRGPWSRRLIHVEGQALSLDDIEHRIVRPAWGDPRVHYIFNCASLGCPNLPLRALTARIIEKELERAAADFVNHPRAVSVSSGKLTVSSIYRWYAEDFGGSEQTVIDHLHRYARPDLAAQISEIREISAYRYDWNLNDQK